MARKDNTFPLHIERQQQTLFENVIFRISRKVVPKLKKQFKKQVKERKELTGDADSFGELLNDLLDEFLIFMQSKFIPNELEKIAFLLDAWARAKTTKSVRRLQKLKKGAAIFELPIVLDPENPFVLDFVGSYVKQNISLVEALGREYIDDVSKLASDTFLRGGSIKDLTRNLLQFTDENVNRAAFWARDQVGDAYSVFTKTRQNEAGIQNYIWRTVGDNAVRGNDPDDQTSHVLLEGQKFNWKKGAADTGQISKPGGKHPGEDYNCRCTAEPIFEEAD